MQPEIMHTEIFSSKLLPPFCLEYVAGTMMTSSNENIFRVTSLLLVIGEFPAQRQVTQSYDVFFDKCVNKRLSKQSWSN